MVAMIVAYFAVAFATYLSFVFVEVKYCDLLEAREDKSLSQEAMTIVFFSLVWPFTFVVLLVALVIISISSAFLAIEFLVGALRPGRFHRRVGFAVFWCTNCVSRIFRRISRKLKGFKNARAPESVEGPSGENQEGSEAGAGGAI